jgi:aminodeoxyfutalosine deaminase
VGNSLASLPALASQALQGTFFHELLGSQDAATGDAPAAARRGYESVVKNGEWPERFACVQAPHAPYSASPSLLQRVFANAHRLDERTTIHVAEDEDEIALLMHGEGRWPAILANMGVPLGERTPRMRPVPYLGEQGAFTGKRSPLLVHMTIADEAEIAMASRASAPVVLCPRSNLHITGRLPNVAAMINAGVCLALGTDSFASNTSLSLWDEMATLAKCFPDVDCAHWLRAATHGGAFALDRPWLGSISVGQKPGLLNVELECATESLLRALTSKVPSNITWVAKP